MSQNGYIREGKASQIIYDKRAVEVGDQLKQMDPREQVVLEPAHDPFQSALIHLQNLGTTGRVVWGRITMALPFVNWYRVALDDGDGDFPCCRLTGDTSHMPIGVRDISMLPPNSPVFVFKHATGNFGYIIGVPPDIVQDGSLSFSDSINQGASTGFKREGYYNEIFTLLDEEGGIIHFAGDQPMDGTVLDWGRISDLGGRVHIDPVMIQLLMDEMCGIELFYADQFTRLSGANMDIRTSVSELQVRNDEGEAQITYGESMYPWESLGAFKPDATTHQTVDPVDVQYEKPMASLEPKEVDQIPFHRYREVGGYLGQGKVRELRLPPDGGTLFTRDGEEELPCVFREQILPTGAYALASSKSVIIAKRSALVSPRQKKQPEDYSEDADNSENYKASGQYGSGDPHKVTDLQPEGDTPQLLSAAAIMDLHAYTFNWQGPHPYHYHLKDYLLSEEEVLPLDQVQAPNDFSHLESHQWMERPQASPLHVDHRYGNANYFNVLSHLSMTDDGAVILGDGYGAEIVLVGGSIQLRCPGDVMLMPGRSIINLAGDDLILRAKNSVDITSSDKDVRIKAEANLHILGGNDGQGGVVIESRGTGNTYQFEGKVGEDIVSPGILLKSPGSQIATMSAGIYLRTGSSDGEVQSGPIVLDADKGQANIIMVGSEINRFINIRAVDTFDVDQPQACNSYTQYRNQFAGLVEIDNQLAVNGNGMYVKGNIVISGGHVASEYSASYNGKVGDLTQNRASLSTTNSRLASVHSAQQALVRQQTTFRQNQIVGQFYASGKVGNGTLQKVIGFGLRDEEQYNTTDFSLPAASWQIQAAAAGNTNTWTEKVVKYGGDEQMPWPGKKKWKDEETFQSVELKLYNSDEGRDRNREDGPYEDPEYGSFTGQTPDGNYPIIM